MGTPVLASPSHRIPRRDTPRHIVLLVADSLRWDSVYGTSNPVSGATSIGDHRLPYLSARATTFHQARSAGCWTLPATASMFTGLSPHEHGADSQTRAMRDDVPTLAERLRRLGFRTQMITANNATTDLFGVSRGFEGIDRAWQNTPAHHTSVQQIFAVLGRPRLRKRLFSPDFISGKMSEDLEATKVWLQTTAHVVFDRARAWLDARSAADEQGFLFLNLMESHFPYHIADTFETSAPGWLDRLRELRTLFHYVNQTWLIRDDATFEPRLLALIRQRQRTAWERLAPIVDAFAQELRETYGATVIFCSDHGDTFGEQDWLYHFSNVSDGGNRVPLMILDHDEDRPGSMDSPVTMKDLYGTVLRLAGDRDPTLRSVRDEDGRSNPVLESYWYNNLGKTQHKYRFNQYAFVDGDRRFAFRSDPQRDASEGRWSTAPLTRGAEVEVPFSPLDPGDNPIEEHADPERRAELRASFAGFSEFSEAILRKGPDYDRLAPR
jgi:arylsulfatase A-like enzyme